MRVLSHVAPRRHPCTSCFDAVELATESQQLTPAQASKLRGQAGWTGSLLHGKCGRLALRFLKERQYAKDGDSSLSHAQMRELRLLLHIAKTAPIRLIEVLKPPQKPVVIYSDASFENGTAKCGWVIFPPGERPFRPVGCHPTRVDFTMGAS